VSYVVGCPGDQRPPGPGEAARHNAFATDARPDRDPWPPSGIAVPGYSWASQSCPSPLLPTHHRFGVP
jgi:hypothetical protein